MNRQEITDILSELVGTSVQGQLINGWVTTRCPLAPFTHATGKDAHPSFGVLVTEGRPSIFNCFTCKKRGPLVRLVEMMMEFTGEDFTHLVEEIDTTELLGAQVPEWGAHGKDKEKLPDDLGEEFWEIYDSAAGHPYLRERRISDNVARKLRLMVDPDDHGVERLLFPVCQPAGGLQGFTGRAINDVSQPKVRDYFGLKKRLLLLGSHLVEDAQQVILVEGPFDYARVHELGHAAVAALHSGLTPHQAKLLIRMGRPVVVMYDNDAAGEEGRKLVKKLVHPHVPLLKARYPEGAKDPGSLKASQLRRMLDTLRLL